MKSWHSLLTHEWRAKLMAVVLATLLWLFLRHSINYSPALPPFPVPPPPPTHELPPPQAAGIGLDSASALANTGVPDDESRPE